MVALKELWSVSSMSKWKTVMSGVCPSISGPVLLKIFVSNMDSRNKCTPSKFADNNKLCGAVNLLYRKGCHPKRP